MIKGRSHLLAAVGGLGVLVACTGSGEAPQEGSGYDLGRPATEAQVKAWDIDVSPTGEGLAPGRGTVNEGGKEIAAKCATCYGPTGVEGPAHRLVVGRRTRATANPTETVGS